MNNTPQANRVHIGIFGRCNSGKSSLVNALTGQDVAVVSDVAGTTTDPVSKAMEIHGIGACTFIDTAGFDDDGGLGEKRLERTRRAVDRTDVAVVVFTGEEMDEELRWIDMFRGKNIPVVAVVNKADALPDPEGLAARIEKASGLTPVVASARTGRGIKELLGAITEAARGVDVPESILGDLVAGGDVVMLVMPQDAQAPKGRLILPQVQTIRDLLDKKCTVVSCVPENMEQALRALTAPPKLIITDSQVFPAVSKLAPEGSLLTSFSVLFARYKGDVRAFIEGAAAIERLTEDSRVLIAEACTHAPLTEDIGREKIPRMLRKRIGEGLKVDIVSGPDFPEDLSGYDLIIHCGACMFNRRHVMSRVARAAAQDVPITNYGITIAFLTGILDKVVYPS